MLPPPGSRLTLLLAVLLLALSLDPVTSLRKQPPRPLPAVIQALKPSGLWISVLDEEGMDLVIINANINDYIELKEPGPVSQTIWEAKDGFWSLNMPTAKLEAGYRVYYWVYYTIKGEARYFEGNHTIRRLEDSGCKPSISVVNGKPACKGDLLFEDHFDSLNDPKWDHIIQFSDLEDVYCTFVNDGENSFVENGILHLRATVEPNEDELYTPLVLEGCTSGAGGEFCERKPFAWNIRPPARSAAYVTVRNFKFRFGRVELRAKAAVGDWLQSRVWLETNDQTYGDAYETGQIEVMRVSGNPDLRPPGGGDNYGANVNQMRVLTATCGRNFFFRKEHSPSTGLLTDDFHIYSFTWTPRGIKFEMDGVEVLDVAPPLPGGFLDSEPYRDCEDSSWENGTFLAPFDREFFLIIGLMVGGRDSFKDGSTSGGHKKPYADNNFKGPLNFWQARDAWLPTWKEDFEIDYIKVSAL